MPFYSAALLCLAVLTPFAHVEANSAIFSQFIGATTAAPPSSTTYMFSICTNYLHGLPPLTGLPRSASIQAEQIAVDGVCQFCTSLDQSRIDSCCGQPTSSACFDKFAGPNAAQPTPASANVMPTATSAGDSGLNPTGSSNTGAVAQVRP